MFCVDASIYISDLIIILYLPCYRRRSCPCRSEMEDDNSLHCRDQQQHLEIKAVVWVSLVAALCIIMTVYTIPSHNNRFLQYERLSFWISSMFSSFQFILCFGVMDLWGQGSLLKALTLVSFHLHNYTLVGATGKNSSGLRLSLHWKPRIEKKKLFLSRIKKLTDKEKVFGWTQRKVNETGKHGNGETEKAKGEEKQGAKEEEKVVAWS